jgi:heat shock protein HtpX
LRNYRTYEEALTERDEAVLGLEMTHIKNRDMYCTIFSDFLSTVAFFIVRYALYLPEGTIGEMVMRTYSCLDSFDDRMGDKFSANRALSRYRNSRRQRFCNNYRKTSKLASALMKNHVTMQRVQ